MWNTVNQICVSAEDLHNQHNARGGQIFIVIILLKCLPFPLLSRRYGVEDVKLTVLSGCETFDSQLVTSSLIMEPNLKKVPEI